MLDSGNAEVSEIDPVSTLGELYCQRGEKDVS